jgi:hypothetical protein
MEFHVPANLLQWRCKKITRDQFTNLVVMTLRTVPIWVVKDKFFGLRVPVEMVGRSAPSVQIFDQHSFIERTFKLIGADESYQEEVMPFCLRLVRQAPHYYQKVAELAARWPLYTRSVNREAMTFVKRLIIIRKWTEFVDRITVDEDEEVDGSKFIRQVTVTTPTPSVVAYGLPHCQRLQWVKRLMSSGGRSKGILEAMIMKEKEERSMTPPSG